MAWGDPVSRERDRKRWLGGRFRGEPGEGEATGLAEGGEAVPDNRGEGTLERRP